LKETEIRIRRKGGVGQVTYQKRNQFRGRVGHKKVGHHSPWEQGNWTKKKKKYFNLENRSTVAILFEILKTKRRMYAPAGQDKNTGKRGGR